MATERLISPESRGPEEEAASQSLRPRSLAEFVGQRDLIERIGIAAAAARERGEPMEHVLLHGPPGLGKTTLAHVIAREMGARVHVTSGPALTRGSDLVGALTRLEPNDVLFIDEIHRLPPAVEEFIYPAMEDYRIDVAVDSGMHARTVSVTVKPFTLIGATTRAGLLTAPLRSRFGIAHHLKHYDAADLLTILERSAGLLGVGADGEALAQIAGRSRGTPRIANRLLRRVRDYAQVRGSGRIEPRVVDEALALEGVDGLGLDELDRAYLRVIGTTYRGGPVGLEAVAATMGEDAGALEGVVEPFLLQVGHLARTRRGRQLTGAGAAHIGVRLDGVRPAPADNAALFG
ncbi:MAG: Holliday junction branch migration DNA helicase RuvB [Planctomycetota bacterium]|nr:MAG: Holliday junction branch migration DNA helicase RuvB [Planctomycetota bacterium]